MVPRQRAAISGRADRPCRFDRQLAAHRRAHGPALEHRHFYGAGISALARPKRQRKRDRSRHLKAKYPTQEAIDQKRNELGDIGFRREMLLQVVPEEGQDVLPEDIHYYDDPPFDDGNYLAHGVDLAISTKESADCTACVTGEVTWPAGKLEIYIQPH